MNNIVLVPPNYASGRLAWPHDGANSSKHLSLFSLSGEIWASSAFWRFSAGNCVPCAALLPTSFKEQYTYNLNQGPITSVECQGHACNADSLDLASFIPWLTLQQKRRKLTFVPWQTACQSFSSQWKPCALTSGFWLATSRADFPHLSLLEILWRGYKYRLARISPIEGTLIESNQTETRAGQKKTQMRL